MTTTTLLSPNGYHDSASPTANHAVQIDDILSTDRAGYSFPHRKLRLSLSDPSRTPLVLVACGSFSPPTFLHLRMFELAADYARDNTNFEVIGGYFSPVNSDYKKEGLVSSSARVRMCSLATKGHDWLSVDDWEALAPSYVRTALVLDHFEEELRKIGGIESEDGRRKPVRVALLAGADLISTFAQPGLWSKEDLEHILGRYGCFILERAGVNIDQSLESLERWISNIWFIDQPIQNDVSSTKIRYFLRKNMSIRYLIPTSVINYIYENGLYHAKLPANSHDRTPSGSKRPSPSPKPTNGGIGIDGGSLTLDGTH